MHLAGVGVDLRVSGEGARQGAEEVVAADGVELGNLTELLNDFDEIAVIPVDTLPDNPIGPMLADDKAAIIGEIRQIGAGGGGIYVRTGLEAAAAALAEEFDDEFAFWLWFWPCPWNWP